MESAKRRVEVLSKQLSAADIVEEFSVALPEDVSTDHDFRVRRSVIRPHRLVDGFEPPYAHVRTLYDLFENALSRLPDVNYLGQRMRDARGNLGRYSWITYAQAGEARTAVGSGIVHLGIQPGMHVGIYSVNCVEWALADHACHAYSMVPVPLYDTFGPDSINYICKHADIKVVFCSLKCFPNLINSLGDAREVRLVVVFGLGPASDPASDRREIERAAEGAHFDVVTFQDLVRLGKANPKPHVPPRPSSLAKIGYTSGTTGVPKGVMTTHSNIIANIGGGEMGQWKNLIAQGDVHVSYLPLAHVYEHLVYSYVTHCGASIGFYSGDVLNLVDDIQELKPTIFVSVPRLWNKIYDKIHAGIAESGPVKRALFQAAYAAKKSALDRGDKSGGRLGAFWDWLVFSKLRARLGGRVHHMISGASPLSPDVMAFLRVCFSDGVFQGYGLSEVGIVAVTAKDDPTLGHVGPPMPCVEMKLADIPDMDYLHSDRPYPRGEICIRGPTVFQGYYKDEEKNKECFDADGWFHTGDVGCWLPGGKLKIIDRKKNLFKLAQGEYVAPEKIEQICDRSPFVAQIFVYGDSFRNDLVAVVSPDPDYLLAWAAERGLPQDLGALCRDAGVTSSVLKSIQEQSRAAKLFGFEQVKAVHLTPEVFSVENGLMTPTFKLKRPQLKAQYQNVLHALYAGLD